MLEFAGLLYRRRGSDAFSRRRELAQRHRRTLPLDRPAECVLGCGRVQIGDAAHGPRGCLNPYRSCLAGCSCAPRALAEAKRASGRG
eukprot:2483250-Rhodomonas_salina.2